MKEWTIFLNGIQGKASFKKAESIDLLMNTRSSYMIALLAYSDALIL
jgi:hypothetical protein